jgi:Holliday junction resolvase RusA-like endonuclease
VNWAGDFVAVSRRARELTAQPPFVLPELITITIDLPYPVSTNRIWRYGKGRVYRSELYKEWMADADAHMLMAKLRAPTIKGMFDAHIYLSQAGGRIDIDNIKCLLDWAQSRRLISNDKHCARLTVERTAGFPETSSANAPFGCRLILREMCA